MANIEFDKIGELAEVLMRVTRLKINHYVVDIKAKDVDGKSQVIVKEWERTFYLLVFGEINLIKNHLVDKGVDPTNIIIHHNGDPENRLT